MRILFFSDLHCHNYEQFSTQLPNGRNSRFQDCLNIVDQVTEICIDRSIDLCIFLGDVFHSRTKVDVDVHTSTWQAFRKLGKTTKLVVMVGNHDQHNKVGSVNSLESFWEFAEVCAIPRIIYGTDGSPSVICYPHISDVEKLLALWRGLPFSYDVVCFHQAVREGTVGPYSRNVNAELSIKDFPFDKGRFFIGGDYHARQFFGPDRRVHYVGSPLQLNFGERFEEKGFTFLDTEKWEFETIPAHAPKFIQVNWGEAFVGSYDYDFIKFIVPSNNWEDALKLKKTYPRILLEKAPVEKTTVARVSKDALKTDTALLEAYIAQSKTDLDQKYLLQVGNNLLQQST